jgi:hypothetical protein
MVKVMLLMKRKPGLSLAEFIERYETIHVPLATKNATKIRHYARHYLHPSPRDLYGNEVGEPEYDVLTELWYDDLETFTRQQDGMRRYPERLAAIIEDEEQLFDRSRSRVAIVEDRISNLGMAEPASDLERSVKRLVDKDEIVDLVHRYSYLVDHQRYDQLVELFTDDCLVDYGPGIGPPARGRRAFRALLGSGAESDGPRRGFLATSHHNANVLVTFESDDRASVVTSVYAWHQAPRGATPRIWGYYRDVAVRTSGGWRLAERQLRVAGSENWEAEWHPLQ